MNITILTYLDKEGDKDFDPVVHQVRQALRKGGHKVSVLGVHDDVKRLIAGLQRRKPELVFHMLEMFGDNVTGDIPVSGLLDLLGLRYTGCSPREAVLSQDKSLTKKILAFEGIQCPRFAIFSADDGDLETGGNLRLPLFVKPMRMDASIGIDAGKKALVFDAKSLMKRVLAIHDECNDAALAEEFIDGREFYVGILGNERPVALPPIEMDFSGLPAGAPRVLDARAKFDESSKEFKGTKAIVADIPDELRARLQKVSLEAYRALRVRDYGRVDLRFTEAGEIYVIEVNAGCYLEKASEFAIAAKAAGIEYPALIQRIVELASTRHDKAQP